jgi:hypothetical protein
VSAGEKVSGTFSRRGITVSGFFEVSSAVGIWRIHAPLLRPKSAVSASKPAVLRPKSDASRPPEIREIRRKIRNRWN